MPLVYPIIVSLLALFSSHFMGCLSSRMQHDDALAAQVSAALLASDELNLSRIEVNVEEGRVYLSGMADDHESKTHAESEAQKIPGVKSVMNKIEVDF